VKATSSPGLSKKRKRKRKGKEKNTFKRREKRREAAIFLGSFEKNEGAGMQIAHGSPESCKNGH